MSAPARISQHALDRALDMALDPEEIRKAITSPERVYWSQTQDCWQHVSGRIIASIRGLPGDRVVTTFIWSDPRAWEKDADLAPLPEGRELRTGTNS